MRKVQPRRLAIYCAAILLPICVATLVIWGSNSRQSGPALLFTTFDPNTGIATVELTNGTARGWSFELHTVEGVPKPSYFITYEKKGLPGWGVEFNEGIYCSGFLHRRDVSGRYLPPERPGRSPKLSTGLTNFVLRPQEALTFSVPVGDILGLSKVGVIYRHPPPSTRLGRAATDAVAQLRHVLNLQPATPFEGWCETPLPISTN